MKIVGDMYPGATVLGVDLSPIQPQWVPPGVKFMVDDVESPWVRPLNHYNYIHGRHLSTGIKNWPLLMSRTLEYVSAPPLHPQNSGIDVGLATSNPAAGSSSKKFTISHNATTASCPQLTP
jgi:hypothetical protein